MSAELTTERRNPISEAIDQLSALEIVRLMNSEDATVAAAVGQETEAIAQAIEVVAERLRRGGRLVYVGAGTSGRLGVLDASECPPTFNSDPGQVLGIIAGGPAALTRAIEGAEDAREPAVAALQGIGLSERDAVFGIATSGRTPYVLAALQYAAQVGAFTIGLSCNRDSALTHCAQLTIAPVVGPEVISGSTRLKAGTATKLVLNMLTTGAMVLLGKTYGNLMVDLRATNSKLVDRSRRIVMTLTGLEATAAEDVLRRCQGEVKTAIVAQRLALAADEARQRLTAVGGHLRRALESPAAAAPAAPPTVAAELVLGVDGGASKTVAWLTSSASGTPVVVGRGTAGPSNPQAVGFSTAFQNLGQAVSAAFADAQLPRTTVRAATLALAGSDRDTHRQAFTEWAAGQRLAAHVAIVHDALPLLAAATPEVTGIALISGTGSLAFGRAADGRTARAGGWGYLFGDEGSGYALAVEGLRAAARAADRRACTTRLLPDLLRQLQLERPAELVAAVYGFAMDRRQVAQLAPTVLAAAAEGDLVADALVSRAANDLAAMVMSVMQQLQLARGQYALALGGGVLVNSQFFRKRLGDKLEGDCEPNSTTLVPDPVLGAVQLALNHCGRAS